MSTTPNLRHGVCRALAFLATAVLALPLAVQAAKPAGGGGGSQVTVTAANPSEAVQGQLLDVIVSGTGFGNGSTVKYLVTGTTDASQVAVLSVEYLPASGQLKTRIQVNEVAVTSDYDIEVRTSSGRKGKGTTLFAVKLDPSVILPVSLGAPPGCDSSMAFRLNDSAYLAGLIVVGGYTFECTKGDAHAYRWQDGAWQDLGTLATAAHASTEGVSNNGTVVGRLGSSSWGAAFAASGGVLSPLPSLAGMFDAHAYGISQDGTHIVGTNSKEGETVAVRWKRDGGGAWSVEAIGDQPSVFSKAQASSDDGSVVIGHRWTQSSPELVREGWVWVEGGSPEWVGLGAATVALDIDPTATMVVGYRHMICACIFTEAVYWTLDSSGNWASHDLAPLDSEFSSYANGVGMVNGKLVIVGRSDIRKDASSISRAVAWLPQAGGGYGPPIQLAPIDGRATNASDASDVNANGVVAGRSSTPKGYRAVLWMLPPIP